MSKIPKQAKKVFTGEIFDVYQWEQKMFDNTTETFEMIKRPNTLLTIATSGDKVLLAKEEQPMKKSSHTLFGGRQEKNETPLEGAKRELLEESGMKSNDWEKLHSYQATEEITNKIDWEVHYFIARNCKKIQDQKLDSGEKIETLKVSFEKFIDVFTKKQNRGHWITYYLKKLKTENKLEEFRKKIFK